MKNNLIFAKQFFTQAAAALGLLLLLRVRVRAKSWLNKLFFSVFALNLRPSMADGW